MDGPQRWRILRLHVEDGISLTTLARDTGTGLRTLQRWHQLYKTGGIAALEPRPRRDTGSRRTPAELVTFLEHLALTRPRPSTAALHRLTTAEAGRLGLAAPSYATVRAIVHALDPALVTLALEGPAAYRDRYELVFRHRAERPNVTWQADHTELDILITGASGTPDRPWLTVVMDDYSRAVCGYMVFTGAPSAMNTALVLRQAIWRKTEPAWAMCGLPDVLYIDHGSDFTSRHLEYTAESGDTVVVWRIDRLGRSLIDVLNTVNLMRDKGVKIKSLSDGIDPETTSGRLMLGMLATLAEYERELITERVNAGIAAAKQSGTRFGRPPVDPAVIAEKLDIARDARAKGRTAEEAARLVGWSRATLYRHQQAARDRDMVSQQV